VLQYFAVALFGGLVGTGELIARYRDDPFRSLVSWYAGVYVGFNVLASIFALFLIHVFGLTFGMASTHADKVRWIQVLVAGFGAMAFFRTSVFVVRAGNQDIGVGPASFLQIILFVADRGVDRRRGDLRSQHIPLIMGGLTWAQVQDSLPPLCIGLMQNLSADEQATIGREVAQLNGDPMPDPVKVLSLGLVLVNYVGEDVLIGAVETLRDQLGLPPLTGTVDRRGRWLRKRLLRRIAKARSSSTAGGDGFPPEPPEGPEAAGPGVTREPPLPSIPPGTGVAPEAGTPPAPGGPTP